MPNYLYICKSCGEHFETYAKYGDHSAECPKCGSVDKDRDYRSEFSGIGLVMDSLGEGFNVSAGVRYKNRQDLHNKMREKGLEPMMGSSVSKVSRPLYADEQREKYYESIKNTQAKDVIVED